MCSIPCATLTTEDLRQIRSIGKSPGEVIDEIRVVREGTPSVTLKRPCVCGDDVLHFTPVQEANLARSFQDATPGRGIVKFVAASGAASRMFRALRPLLERTGRQEDKCALEASSASSDVREAQAFLDHVDELALFDQLQAAMASRGQRIESLQENGCYREIIECLLSSGGLNYGSLPKGLLPYHRYPDGPRTAMQEHLVEAAGYAKGSDGVVRVHFTVSPEHREKVRLHLEDEQKRLEQTGARYEVTISLQKESTSAVALDRANALARDAEGRLIFKPSGHGALLDNLNSLGGDIVFLKTVDNVLPDRLKGTVCFYKRVLGGYLIALEQRIHGYLRALSSGRTAPGAVQRIQRFAQSRLFIRLSSEFDALPLKQKADILYRKLNRPLRICGVVTHQGDPGGAPFWIMNREEAESLRIVEEREVDHNSEEQSRIWRSSTYFNPVDIVCSVRDFRGQPFHLPDYGDPDAGFVVLRWHGNRQIKFLERPGLWNGAMARWNTVFVEVPRVTVHPVKSIVDLLSWQHRS